MKDYQEKVRDLRRALEELRHEKDLTDSKLGRLSLLEETVTKLRQANRSLEEKITRLCEAPFINDAFGQHDAKLKYEDLLRERQDMRAKIEHLQEAVKTHFSALTSLKQHANQLREEKELMEKTAEELKLKLKELQVGKNMLQDQLQIYSGDDGVDIESLEKALTMVKRRSEAMGKLPFLEDTDGEVIVTIPTMKRKLEEYQHLNLKLTEENEKLENMLKLQTGINRDMHKELELLTKMKHSDKLDLQQKADSLAELALKRLNKIHSLEAQVRQFVYGLSKNSSKFKNPLLIAPFSPEDKENTDNNMLEADNNRLLADLIGDGSNSLRPDENILEVWVKSAAVRDGILNPGSSSFVVVDFFDFESQATSLMSGIKPQWDFAATYKIFIDDFLIRHICTDCITLELNMVKRHLLFINIYIFRQC